MTHFSCACPNIFYILLEKGLNQDRNIIYKPCFFFDITLIKKLIESLTQTEKINNGNGPTFNEYDKYHPSNK